MTLILLKTSKVYYLKACLCGYDVFIIILKENKIQKRME